MLIRDRIRKALEDHMRILRAVHAVGGIAEVDVVRGTASVPPGWILNRQIYYYVPPDFDPDKEVTIH